MPEQAKGEKVFRGIAVSAGICRGKILILHRARHIIARRGLADNELNEEVGRFEKALVQTRQQILEIQGKVLETLSAKEADIFEAHLLMLEDRVLVEEVIRMIRDQKVNADFAFHTVAERYVTALVGANDEYLRERANDMRDLAARVLDNLLEVEDKFDLRHLAEPCILVSHDLSPSTTAQLDKKFVLGFATDIGGQTSHTAIMARSLGIPAVVGLQTVSQELDSGDYALLDGYNGTVIVNPTDQTLFEYGQLAKIKASLEEKLHEIQQQPAVTLDGKFIHLSANIEDQNDIESVLAHGAEGVGLFRTEYLFINHESLPTEEEQYQSYRKVATALKPNPVIIRTLDLGGDKFASHLQLAKEVNPFLGWRAIRFCLAQPELFRAQLRAILRASAEGNVKMMYPMISGLEELNQANALLEKCRAELRTEGLPFDERMEVGAMIEIPSAALIADVLAPRVKFFSIGSNDLIQYTLAADRTNEKVSHLYEPTHPAIIRLIKTTVDAAHRHGIWVGVCGEVAGDPVLAPLLIGLGVDELSAAPTVVAQVKYIVRRLKLSEAQALAEFALQCESPAEIHARCQELARQTAPSLFESKT
ncbi:MAG TPA: phosphoenolpyruvate--protein phosphotransferase [Candidatus Limnocylindrales bacterium]|nr:phosphoenolpyruvate--protein phosphotransferase [Candidatus Limnocylindrales bacterium]